MIYHLIRLLEYLDDWLRNTKYFTTNRRLQDQLKASWSHNSNQNRDIRKLLDTIARLKTIVPRLNYEEIVEDDLKRRIKNSEKIFDTSDKN